MTTFDNLTSDNYEEIIKYVNYEDIYALRLVNCRLNQICHLQRNRSILKQLISNAANKIVDQLDEKKSIAKFLSSVAFTHYALGHDPWDEYQLPLCGRYYTDKLEEVMTAYDSLEFEQSIQLLELHPQYHPQIKLKANNDYRGNIFAMWHNNFKCGQEVNDIVSCIYKTKKNKAATSVQVLKYLKEIAPAEDFELFISDMVDRPFLIQYPHWIPLISQYVNQPASTKSPHLLFNLNPSDNQLV